MGNYPSAERQKEIIEEIYYKGLNTGDLSVADQYIAEDYRSHGSHDDSMRGPEAFKFTIRKQRSAFSDVEYEILDLISMDDRSAVRWVMRGRHTGEFLGVEPTGKTVEHNAIIWLRFEGEKIVERWGIIDNFSLMRVLRGGSPLGGPPAGGPPAGRPAPANA
jgi:predicted ester cyclase